MTKKVNPVVSANVAYEKRLMSNWMRVRMGVDRTVDRDNAAVNPKGKKAVPARRAPVGGNAEQTKRPGEHPGAMLAGNSRQIHVSAHSTVHVMNVTDGSRPRVKTQIAAAAPPGAQ